MTEEMERARSRMLATMERGTYPVFEEMKDFLGKLADGSWLGDAGAATYPFPRDGIVCFHCGKRFHTPGSARHHFGDKPHEVDKPACLSATSPAPAKGDTT
jgi:hypothetical protein